MCKIGDKFQPRYEKIEFDCCNNLQSLHPHRMTITNSQRVFCQKFLITSFKLGRDFVDNLNEIQPRIPSSTTQFTVPLTKNDFYTSALACVLARKISIRLPQVSNPPAEDCGTEAHDTDLAQAYSKSTREHRSRICWKSINGDGEMVTNDEEAIKVVLGVKVVRQSTGQ
jgi:hypothetical protein